MTLPNAQSEHRPGTILPFTDELPKRFPSIGAMLAMSPEERARWDSELDRQSAANNEQRRTGQIAVCIRGLSASLGERYSPARCSLESFRVNNAKQQAAIDRLTMFDVASGRGLVLYGTVGTGKDHLLAAMLYRACRQGLSASWINGPEIYCRFRDAFDTEAKEEAILNRFVRPAVLGVSDPVPQVGDASSWRTEILYRIIEFRYRQMRPTWLTINAASPDDADAKLTAPVFDRLREDAELIPCFWPSFREGSKR